jgi:histidine triad (HIT) family protein
MNCAFCKIVAGESDSRILYQDEAITAFPDIRPQAPTHILVVPNGHVVSMKELLEPDNSLLVRMFSTAHSLAETEGIADRGYRLVINTGPEAGQLIEHVHLHLLGGKPMRLEAMALRFRDGMEYGCRR